MNTTSASPVLTDPAALLDRIRLRRVAGSGTAGLQVVSLPWPRLQPRPLSLHGEPAQALPLGCWPGTDFPRRLLLFADSKNHTPAEIPLAIEGGEPSGMMPVASMDLVAQSRSRIYAWQRHCLRIRHGNKTLALMLGMRTGGELHWWEACGLSISQETPGCTVLQMAGSIPHRLMSEEEFVTRNGYHNSFLHKHNWLAGQLFVRLHANGVVEIHARHVNNKFVDDGCDLEDAVPVIGFLESGSLHGISPGPLDGSVGRFSLGGVGIDAAEAARLARPEQPGHLEQSGDMLVWQPYSGAELYGGICPQTLTGDPFIFHAESKLFPRGIARTVRFSASFTDRSPEIARYVAPAWWYGLCEEFVPVPLLPVSDATDATQDLSRAWAARTIVRGGFEDGSLVRGVLTTGEAKGRPRDEPGWEGELPYALFLAAWRGADPGDYANAMRSAWYFTDVCVDHAVKLVRMHGFPPPAVALPMNRMQAAIAAYLETGDPFLLETAEAVTANAHWQHKNSWPRMAVGRDACYLRSAVLLHRYTGSDFFLRIAREGARCVAESQRPNGSFGDQGGGCGIHQWGGFITKPWMGLLAVNPLLDLLELFPGDTLCLETVRAFADWLMSERLTGEHGTDWAYQHDYNGGREFFDPVAGKFTELPSARQWHHESFARLLGFCSLAFGDPSYYDAWAQSHATKEHEKGDHSSSAALQFLPWLQCMLWQARWENGAVVTSPKDFGPRTPDEAVVLSPDGPVHVRRPSSGHDRNDAPAKNQPVPILV